MEQTKALQLVTPEAIAPMVQDAIQALVPTHALRERFAAVIINQLRSTPNIQKCAPDSIVAAVASIVQLGLDPALSNEVFIVPFWNKQRNCYEAQRIIGFAGLKKLAMRHPDVVDIFCAAVHERDTYESGDNPMQLPLHKRPPGFAPRGKVIGYYAAAKMRGGHWRVVECSKTEIRAHKERYSLGQRGTFWDDNRPDLEGLTNFDKMGLKTVLRKLCHPRELPHSVTYTEMAALEYQEQEVEQDMELQRSIPDMTEPAQIAAGDAACADLFGEAVVTPSPGRLPAGDDIPF